MDESKAMKDLNGRIQQLTKLILTRQTVDDVAVSTPTETSIILILAWRASRLGINKSLCATFS